MPRLLRSLVLLGALAALGTLGTACGSDDPVAPTDRGLIRVVHTSPDGPVLDVLVEGVRVYQGLGFAQFFGYSSIPAGERQITLSVTNSNDAVIDVTQAVSVNVSYSIFAIGLASDNSIQPLVLTDDRTPPGADQVKLRVLNASPGAGAVDFYITAPTVDLATVPPTLGNVAFGANAYVPSTPAGRFRFRATTAGTKDVIMDTGSQGGALQGGQVYTVVALDAQGGGAPFQLRLLVDSQG